MGQEAPAKEKNWNDKIKTVQSSWIIFSKPAGDRKSRNKVSFTKFSLAFFKIRSSVSSPLKEVQNTEVL
jgi:hypothetical protein